MRLASLVNGSTHGLPWHALIRLNIFLASIAIALIGLDATWVWTKGFDIDIRSYAIIGLVLSPLVVGTIIYSRLRPDPLISATCACVAFLLAFSASCELLSYLLSTVAGTRADGALAQIDRLMGFHWVDLMILAAKFPAVTAGLRLCYVSVMPQIMLLVCILGWSGRLATLYDFCLAIALGALACVFIWAIHPSFGAFSIFNLPAVTASKLGLALDGNYGRDLVALLRNGPGFITPLELRGIVGFPSFHTVQALVLIWYTRRLPVIRWAAAILNLLVLIATPIHGGHHLIDLFGGAAVTLAAIPAAGWIVRSARRPEGLGFAGGKTELLETSA